MDIEMVNNQAKWNTWAQENGASFLQSLQWGDILIAEGKEVERLAIVENGETIAQAQIVYSKLPLGVRYGFCAGGPVLKCRMKNDECRINDQIYECLIDYLKSKNCIFFRFEPPYKLQATSYKLSKTIDITPRATTTLDLIKTDDQLLTGMHEKTRYNIRLAERKDLKIERFKDFGVFWDLMKKTGERDGFRLHDQAHYRAILISPMSYQLTISNEQLAIATGLFVGSGDTFTYLFGASDHEFRNLMAPYLIQWEGIKLGKQLGFKKYDFFGIAPNSKKQENNKAKNQSEYEYDSKHQYAGVTRFKLGFGGEVSEKPGTYDLIISPIKYKIYNALRKLRRLV